MDATFLEIARKATSGSSRVQASQDLSEQHRLRASTLKQTQREFSPTVRLRLIDDDGTLEWETAEGLPLELDGFRSLGANQKQDSFDVLELEFDRLPPSRVTQFLSNRDEKLTPHRGLRRLDLQTGTWIPADVPADGRVLLFVHGTFSNSENMIAGLRDPGNADGATFLAEAERRYQGNLFAFDHPTLSVGPILNALDLQRLIGHSSATFDLVGHSRGGLVARWWCETFDPHAKRCEKVLYVGSPLAGTSLAAPPNIRKTISLLTHLSRALQVTSGAITLAVPVFSVVETLLRVLTSISSLAAKTPVADAAMAMVPGLFAMSRVGNNPELQRLLTSPPSAPERYHAIRSDFQPTDPAWKFWRSFRPARLANTAADTLFGGANDLVVDTASMTTLSDELGIAAARVRDFGTSEVVHHLNYFHQAETATFLGDTLL